MKKVAYPENRIDDYFKLLHCHRSLMSKRTFKLIEELEVAENRVERFLFRGR